MNELRVYVCNRFTGHYPVGVAAAVVSDSQENAAKELNEQLKQCGLPGDAAANDMGWLMTKEKQAIVLCDGNY